MYLMESIAILHLSHAPSFSFPSVSGKFRSTQIMQLGWHSKGIERLEIQIQSLKINANIHVKTRYILFQNWNATLKTVNNLCNKLANKQFKMFFKIVDSFCCCFFRKNCGGHESFCGATNTPVLDFRWCLSWISKPGWLPRLHASTAAHNGCLRYTSGATPANLWQPAWQPITFPTCI